LVEAYRRPVPLLAAGQALARHATAMMDVSDGLLLDALRLARASGCAAEIDLGAVLLSDSFIAARGGDLDARLFAATGGDDYALLAALPAELDPSTLSLPSGTRIACIGVLTAGPPDIRLANDGQAIELPERLGHEHRSSVAPPVADRA
jgi:thiamine-monophosphate kinase